MASVKVILKKLINYLKKSIKGEEKHIKLHKQILRRLEKLDEANNKKK